MTGKAKRRVFPSDRPNHDHGPSCEPTSASTTARRHHRVTKDRIMRHCSPSTSLDGNDSNPHTADPSRAFPENQLPEFGSVLSYGITPLTQKQLWGLEVERLIEITANGTTETLRPDLGIAENRLLHSSANGEAFDKLREVADHVANSLQVCIYDDTAHPSLGAQNPNATRNDVTLKHLEGLYVSTPQPSLPGLIEKSHPRQPRLEYNQTTKHQDNPPTRISCLDEAMIEPYYHLVDQITATLAHLAVLGRENDYWQVIVLACLAKVSTKLKVLVHDLPKNIRTCLDSHRGVRHSHTFLDESENRNIGLGPALDNDSPVTERYIAECCAIFTWLTDCFMEVLIGLGAQKSWWTESRNFDLSVLVYPAGVRGTRTLLSQDRKGTISGTSEAIPMSFASNALDMVGRLGDCLPLVPRNSGTRSGTFEGLVHLALEFEWPSGDAPRCKSQDRPLLTILDFIVISIPLALSSSKVGHGFAQCLQTISTLPAFGRPTSTESQSNFYGFVRLRSTRSKTDQSITTRNGTVESDHQHGFQIASTLATSFLTTIRHNPLQRFHSKQLESHPTEKILLQAQRKREDLENTTKTWMVKENSIIINCHVYVGVTLSFAAVLVAGGLLCGFLVGERVPGVDPFNLTMFSWIIGGFGILVAKSIRVSDWSWRDFLLRRVTCRTVKEVADVTGMDPQDVLVFLLSDSHSPLKTSGPFQGAFGRPSEYDGFSIDVKPVLQTLLASGIVPVIVQTLTGPGLVCLRLMAGHNGLKTVRGAGKLNDRRDMFPDLSVVCTDPPHQDEDRDGVLILESIEWFKVLGVYNFAQARFR